MVFKFQTLLRTPLTLRDSFPLFWQTSELCLCFSLYQNRDVLTLWVQEASTSPVPPLLLQRVTVEKKINHFDPHVVSTAELKRLLPEQFALCDTQQSSTKTLGRGMPELRRVVVTCRWGTILGVFRAALSWLGRLCFHHLLGQRDFSLTGAGPPL